MARRKSHRWLEIAGSLGLGNYPGACAGSLSVGSGTPAPPDAPIMNAMTNIVDVSFSDNWTAVATATTYFLDVALDAGFTTFLSGFENKNVGNVTTYSVTGASPNTTYYSRVRASNGSISANSNTASGTTYTSEAIAFQTRALADGASYYSLDVTNQFEVITINRGVQSDIIGARAAKMTGYRIGAAPDTVDTLYDVRSGGILDRLQSDATRQFTVNTVTHVISSNGAANKNMASVSDGIMTTLPLTFFVLVDFSALANGKCIVGASGGKLNIYNNGGQLSCADGGVDYNVGAVPVGKEWVIFIKNGASSEAKLGDAAWTTGNGGTRTPLDLVAGAFGNTGAGAASSPDMGSCFVFQGAMTHVLAEAIKADLITLNL